MQSVKINPAWPRLKLMREYSKAMEYINARLSGDCVGTDLGMIRAECYIKRLRKSLDTPPPRNP